jgi:outer membrane immunogenic protein
MKKLVMALTAVAAFSAPAVAADMAAKAPLRAAPVAYAPGWTGFYVGGGFGYGMWTADTTTQNPLTGACVLCVNQQQGGKGYFGSVSAGYDWQFGGAWVLGIFGDGQFGDIKGTIQDQGPFFAGDVKMRTAYAAGARLGYLVAPNVLSYVNAGYSGSEWSGATMVDTRTGVASLFSTPSFRRDGWFVGGGVEHSLDIFGLKAPGWFVKTEYRLAEYDRIVLPDATAAGARQNDITFKPFVQTIKTEIVYRFNWGGAPIAAKY